MSQIYLQITYILWIFIKKQEAPPDSGQGKGKTTLPDVNCGGMRGSGILSGGS
jgi:hypothetical protein